MTAELMDAAYATRYRELYDQHWWWRAREAWVLARLTESLAPQTAGPILDVGCGDGLFFEALRRFGEPEGLEADAAVVTEHGRHRGQIHIGAFDESFEPGKRYRLILMLDVLEHIADGVAALTRARELLLPGGRLMLTVPAFQLLWTTHDELNHHRLRYERRSLRQDLEQAGFERYSMRYFFHWLFPLKMVVRIKEMMVGGRPTVPTVPGPALNRLFYAVSRLEQATWGRLAWPLGSSLWAEAGG